MNAVEQVINDLVIANRILAREEIVDAYGHVSVRHPENAKHFFLSRSLSPELVTAEDIIEHDMEAMPVGNEHRSLYSERSIHAALLEARPEFTAIVHAHSEEILPFGIAKKTALRPVIHSASFIGSHIPVWDIREKFGDTNLLVSNMNEGRDLAKALGQNSVVLMACHGFAAGARSLIEVVRIAVYLSRNARALLNAKLLGGPIRYLSNGEIAVRDRVADPYSSDTWRAWEYWATRAGCANLLSKPEGSK